MQQYVIPWTLNGEPQVLVTPWAGGGKPLASTLLKSKPLAERKLSAADNRAIREVQAAVREAKAKGKYAVRRNGEIALVTA